MCGGSHGVQRSTVCATAPSITYEGALFSRDMSADDRQCGLNVLISLADRRAEAGTRRPVTAPVFLVAAVGSLVSSRTAVRSLTGTRSRSTGHSTQPLSMNLCLTVAPVARIVVLH
jgi:hypothetical protein